MFRRIQGAGAMALAVFLANTTVQAAEGIDADGQAPAPQTTESSEPADSPVPRDQIIVYGDKRGRTLEDVEASVLIHTGAEIEEQGLGDLYDVIARTPNAGSTLNDRGFTIRGIDQIGFAAPGGTGLLLSVAVDNVALPTAEATYFGPYSAWDLEQVEVFRGGIGTKQGRNALAGAILIRTADPTYDFEVKGRGSFGQRGSLGTAGAVNLPIVDDHVALRVSVDWRRDNGSTEDPTLNIDHYDKHEYFSARAKLRFDAGPRTKAIVAASFSRSDVGDDIINEQFWPEDRIITSDFASGEVAEHQTASLEITHDFGDGLTLTSITSGSFHDYFRLQDIDFTEDPDGIYTLDRSDWTAAQELRLNFEFGRFSGVAGLYGTRIHGGGTDYLESSVAATLNAFVPGLPLGPLIAPILDALFADVLIVRDTDWADDTWNGAVFGEVTYQVTDKLSVTAGARYDYEKIDGTFYSATGLSLFGLNFVPPPGFTIPGVPVGVQSIPSETSFDAFLPKAAITYDWTDRLTTIASVQRGYRAGGRSRSFLTGTVTEYDPEYTWSYELAVRATVGTVRIDANLFYMDWTDQQVGVPIGGNALDLMTVNAARSRLMGAEAQASIMIAEGLDAYGAFGYARGRFIDFDEAGTSRNGNEFPQAPRLSASWGARYRAPFGMIARVDMRFETGSFLNPANDPQFKSDPSFMIGAMLGYEAEHWSIIGRVDNLLNNDVAVQRFEYGGTYALRPANPRTALIEVSARW